LATGTEEATQRRYPASRFAGNFNFLATTFKYPQGTVRRKKSKIRQMWKPQLEDFSQF